MWYKLNNAIGIILLATIVGGGAIYGLIAFFNAPPVLRQSWQGDSDYQKRAAKDLRRRLDDLQQQSDAAIQRSIDIGRSATGS